MQQAIPEPILAKFTDAFMYYSVEPEAHLTVIFYSQ